MDIPELPFSILPMSVAILIVILDLGWHQRTKPFDSVDLVMLAGAGWLATHAFEINAVDLETKVFWNKVQFIAIISAPIGWYLASQTFIVAGKSNKYHNIFIIVFLPIALLIIIASDWHRLLWFNARLNPINPYGELIFDRGVAYWIFIGIAYYLVVISLIPFARSAAYYRNLFGKQAVVLIFSAFLPLLGSVFDLLDIHLIPTLELTPLTFAISRMAIIRVDSQLRVGDIVPVVRDVIIDNIIDGIIVLDSEDIILDHNLAVSNIIQNQGESLIGEPIQGIWNEIFETPWMMLKVKLNSPQVCSTRRKNAQQRTYQVTSNPVQLRPKHFRGTILHLNDISTAIEFEERINTSLEEKEKLLQEIHHYIRNNLQIVSSLAGLLAHQISDLALQDIYRESQNRIQSMALIHDKLYQTKNLVNIEFGEYVRDLVSLLVVSHSTIQDNPQIQVDSDDITIDIDTGISCGLILNELVSNALKHAFPEGTGGEIQITARENPSGQLCLSVSDNGVGLPEGFELSSSQSLGLKLVETLSRQLNGVIKIDRRDGTIFVLECPIHR